MMPFNSMERRDCIFCKIARKEIPAEIVFENDQFVAFKDIAPKAPIHVLIIPKKHFATARDLLGQDQSLFGDVLAIANQIMSDACLGKKDYRLTMNCGRGAGQVVFHIHFHVLAGKTFSA